MGSNHEESSGGANAYSRGMSGEAKTGCAGWATIMAQPACAGCSALGVWSSPLIANTCGQVLGVADSQDNARPLHPPPAVAAQIKSCRYPGAPPVPTGRPAGPVPTPPQVAETRPELRGHLRRTYGPARRVSRRHRGGQGQLRPGLPGGRRAFDSPPGTPAVSPYDAALGSQPDHGSSVFRA